MRTTIYSFAHIQNLKKKQYIKPYYFKRPNTIKFFQLMNSGSEKEFKQLCKFEKLIMKLFVT